MVNLRISLNFTNKAIQWLPSLTLNKYPSYLSLLFPTSSPPNPKHHSLDDLTKRGTLLKSWKFSIFPRIQMCLLSSYCKQWASTEVYGLFHCRWYAVRMQWDLKKNNSKRHVSEEKSWPQYKTFIFLLYFRWGKYSSKNLLFP